MSDSDTLPPYELEGLDIAATLHDLHLMTPVTRKSDVNRRCRSLDAYSNQPSALPTDCRKRFSSNTSFKVAPPGVTATAPRFDEHSNFQPASPSGAMLGQEKYVKVTYATKRTTASAHKIGLLTSKSTEVCSSQPCARYGWAG
jgi:hypothetical protein